MTQVIPLLLDLAAIVFVIVYIKRSARRGFIRMVVQLVGFFASILLANALSGPAAEYIFQNFMRERLVENVTQKIASAGSVNTFLQSLAALLESIPAFLVNTMEFAGFDSSAALSALTGSVEQLSVNVVDTAIKPTCVALFSAICFLVLFSLFMFLTRMVARCFTSIRHIPLVGTVNSLLGGIVGGVEGIFTLYLIVMVLSVLMAISGDSIPILNRETIESTWLLRFMMEKNALGKLTVPDFFHLSAMIQTFYRGFTGI